jgi:anionic cell wall polymer biosynthesis LytR-Cps2A-Psr (LCP) family protein
LKLPYKLLNPFQSSHPQNLKKALFEFITSPNSIFTISITINTTKNNFQTTATKTLK